MSSSSRSATDTGEALDPAESNAADARLVEAARGGDALATERLIERMRAIARILTMLNHRLGAPLGPHDLADVGQDTAVHAWRKLAQFNGSSSLETWFYGIARRELLNALRRRRKHEAEEVGDHAHAEGGSEALDLERLRLGLSSLDPEEARMIRLHHFDGLTLEQASERAGLSLSTAKRRYYAGLARLYAFLQGRARNEER